MTAHHLNLWQWSMTCVELYAENVYGLEPQVVAEVVKECANRMNAEEDPWQALLDANRMADEIARQV